MVYIKLNSTLSWSMGRRFLVADQPTTIRGSGSNRPRVARWVGGARVRARRVQGRRVAFSPAFSSPTASAYHRTASGAPSPQTRASGAKLKHLRSFRIHGSRVELMAGENDTDTSEC